MTLPHRCYARCGQRYLRKLLGTPKFSSRPCSPAKDLSYESIPRSPGMPIIGSLPFVMKAGGAKYYYKYIDNLHKQLGPVFVDRSLGQDLVFVADAKANMEIYRTEGPHPKHFIPESWLLYLKKNKKERGIFFMDGPEWLKYRQLFNRILLKVNTMEPHVEEIAAISSDMMDMWKKNPPADKLQFYLYGWSIECLGKIALGGRLRFLETNSSGKEHSLSREEDFVKAIYDSLIFSNDLMTFPVKISEKLNTKAWKRFHSAVSKSLYYGQLYVDEAVEKCSTNLDENRRNSLLYRLMVTENIDKNMVSKLLIDLFFASADTTSHAASWALYLLGRNPDKAKLARAEVERILRKEGQLTLKALNEMIYMRGIIKETLRLYPIAPFLNRVTTQKISLCNYEIPPGKVVSTSIYTMGRDSNNYTDPDSFIPERWIRNKEAIPSSSNVGNLAQHDRKAYVPWGLGARSCVGKRIAEAELTILLATALLSFEWTVNKDIGMVMQMISVPGEDVILQLKSLI